MWRQVIFSFPPETAFQPHMIPALLEARGSCRYFMTLSTIFGACQQYPYAGSQEGMLPPESFGSGKPRS